MNEMVAWAMNWLVWVLFAVIVAYALKWVGVYDVSAQSWGYWAMALVAAALAYVKPILA